MAFAVVPGVPVNVSVTHGSSSERDELKKFVKPGGFYVADRGYANNAMFRDFDAQGVQFLIRVQENTSYEVLEERLLSSAEKAAGVLRDVTVKRLGTEKHNALLERPLRIVQIQGSEPDQIWTLATNAHHLSPDLIGIAYRYRWQVELFFRWFKCILGCRHLLIQRESGVMLQVYSAIIATLMVSLWSETKPNKRTYEMICHYLSGWATEEELITHLEKMKNQPP